MVRFVCNVLVLQYLVEYHDYIFVLHSSLALHYTAWGVFLGWATTKGLQNV